jgi:EAL domain-containing protein (putative c-di-GMP-specific phosphodiesterase class I)
MAVWRRTHPRLRFMMRMNMSPAQLASRNIVPLVADCLAANELPGRVICFEITEHAVMQDVEQSVQRLHELKSLGVSLAIDDFGTGFSSMAQLKRLPVDILKIDQSFVAGLGADGGDHAIIEATVRLAKSFGLDVVAEGIETPEQLDALVRLGAVRGQGYYLWRPNPPEALEELIAAGRKDLDGDRCVDSLPVR